VVGRLDEDATGRLLLEIHLLAAPAARWWARQTVESTFASQVISFFAAARAWSWVTIRAQGAIPLPAPERSWTRSRGP
jgi:hypothetical protein